MTLAASLWAIRWWEALAVPASLVLPAVVIMRRDEQRRRQRNIERRIRDRYQPQ